MELPRALLPWAEHLSLFDPASRSLEISIGDAGGRARRSSVSLELPDERICTQIIRNPSGRTGTGLTRSDLDLQLDSNLLFTGGTKAMALKKDGVLALPVPNSPNDKGRKSVLLRSYGTSGMVAIARVRKRLVVSASVPEPGVVVLAALGNQWIEGSGRYSYLPADPSARPAPRLQSLLVCRSPATRKRSFVVPLPDGMLLRLHEGTTMASELESDIRAAVLLSTGLCVATLNGNIWKITLYDQNESSHERLYPVDKPGRIFFGYANPATGVDRIVAIEGSNGNWWFEHGQQSRVRHAPSSFEIAGIILPAGESEPGFLVIDADRCGLGAVGRSYSRSLVRFLSPIVDVAVSCLGPHIAIRTEDGMVSIFSIPHNDLLYRTIKTTP